MHKFLHIQQQKQVKCQVSVNVMIIICYKFLMKFFLTLFVLLFSSSVVADDISDFEIEGISIGDSLLDYMSEEEIISEIDKNKKRLTRHIYFYTALKDLKEKPTYEEMFPEKHQEGLIKGKKWAEELDKIRGTDIKKILIKDKRILEWWTNI